MYLHLGQNTVICTKEIVGIFDLDNTTVSKITRDMLRTVEKNRQTVTIGTDIPKSFLVCAENKEKKTVYISPITPATLTKRIQKKSIGAVAFSEERKE